MPSSPELVEDICGACQGSGEGYCDNSICWACKGSGVVYRTPDGELADPDTNDEDPPTKDRRETWMIKSYWRQPLELRVWSIRAGRWGIYHFLTEKRYVWNA